MMRSEVLRDRLLQIGGLIVLVALTAALLFAFREKLLPAQEEGDVFATVYAMPSEDPAEASSEAESDTASGAASETASDTAH